MDNNFNSLGDLLVKSKNILILIPGRPSVDATAAALAFYLSLRQTGKQAVVACPEPITVNLNRLVAVDKITDKIGSRNLVVSFDYVQDSIEKVSYNISQGKFNLVIEPKGDFPHLSKDKVSYSYTGAACDLIVIIGAARLENLGRLYEEERKIFTDCQTVNIDNSLANTHFGKTNLVDPQASSCSELVGSLVKNLNLPVNTDIATNLIAGIESATGNFATKTRAETFELIAWGLKNGGRRGHLRVAPSQPFDARPFMTPQQLLRQPAPAQPQPSTQPTFPSIPSSPPATTSAKSSAPQPPSPDWLKPKIYKGSSPIK